MAEVLRYRNRAELERLLERHGGSVAGLGVLLTTEVDARLLDRLPRLRVIATYAVGTDNVDVEAAAARGIVVAHTPDVLTEATADLTWALILAVARRLPEAWELARSGEWTGWKPDQLLGKELHGGTLGILGPGRIGTAVARRGEASGMSILLWSRRPRPELESRPGWRRAELDRVLGAADVVSVHLPLTPETRHLLDGPRIGSMKTDAILVNTARGPIIDEDALATALERGHLFGAGLDVHEREPDLHPRLRRSRRALLLPHVGSATVVTREAMAFRMAENIRAVLTGTAPPSARPADIG